MRPILSAAAAAFNGAVYVIVALPALVVIGASLNPSSALRFPPIGFSFEWYVRTFNNRDFMDSLLVSTHLAALSTLLSLAVGIPAAYALARYRFAGSNIVQAILLSPLLVPAVVFAIGLLQLLSLLGLARTLIGLVLGHLVVTLPYVLRNMTSVFALFDPSLEQAARNLRANWWQTLRRVTIPVLFPGVLSSGIFAFAISFGNLTVSMFLIGTGTTTLPVQIYAYVDQSLDPSVAAVSTLVILITLSVIFLVEWIVGLQRVV